MRIIYPSFYPEFQCRAAHCRHSCCRGWEIDIDGETAEKYRTMSGPLAEEIQSCITEENGTTRFVLTSEGNCPMLREDGLCRLILSRGEDDLCDICALHPRFFEEYGGYELWGLGLSCEEACALLMASPLTFRRDDSDTSMTMEALLDLLAVPADPALLRFRPEFSPSSVEQILSLFAESEPIDEDWTREISRLRSRRDEMFRAAQEYASRSDHGRFQKLLEYILYRQLENLPGESFPHLAAYAQICTRYLFLRDAFDGEDPEHIRRFSEQMEYSEENTLLLRTRSLRILQ